MSFILASVLGSFSETGILMIAPLVNCDGELDDDAIFSFHTCLAGGLDCIGD
jgi:hypothetical protein